MASRIEDYIKSAGDSTARARRLMAVMVSGAILLIGTYANAFAGFRGRRLRELQAALDYLDAAHSAKAGVQQTVGGLPVRQNLSGQEAWAAFRDRRPFASDSVVEAELRADAAALRLNLLKDVSTVSLPLVGVSIDVGDLWIVAALGLTLLQVALIYATGREIADLTTTLKLARDSDDEDDWQTAYDLLSMRQLFTVPPGALIISSKLAGFIEALWRFVPKLLFWLPPGAQVFGLVVGSRYAARTLATPLAPGGFGFVKQYWPELLTVAVSTVLTIIMIVLEQKNDRVWHRYKPTPNRRPRSVMLTERESAPAQPVRGTS